MGGGRSAESSRRRGRERRRRKRRSWAALARASSIAGGVEEFGLVSGKKLAEWMLSRVRRLSVSICTSWTRVGALDRVGQVEGAAEQLRVNREQGDVQRVACACDTAIFSRDPVLLVPILASVMRAGAWLAVQRGAGSWRQAAHTEGMNPTYIEVLE